MIRIETVPVGELQANGYVLSREGREDAIVIDPGAEEPAIRLALGQRKIAAILLTHGHYDHIGAVAALRADGAPVYIGAQDAQNLINPLYSLAAMFGGAPSQGAADFLLEDNETLTLAGIRLRVLHTPGHTEGGCCFLTDEGQLFSGDTLFRRGWGRTDFPGGSEMEMAASLKRLRALSPETRVGPGHGLPTTIGEER